MWSVTLDANTKEYEWCPKDPSDEDSEVIYYFRHCSLVFYLYRGCVSFKIRSRIQDNKITKFLKLNF